MEEKLKEIKEALGKAVHEFKGYNDKFIELEKAGKTQDSLHTEALEKSNTAIGDMEKKMQELQLAFDRKGEEQEKEGKILELKFQDHKHLMPAFYNKETEQYDEEQNKIYKTAFHKYLKSGDKFMSNFSPEEVKALSVGSDPNGGYFVRPEVSSRIVTHVFESSVMGKVASSETISTDAIEIGTDLGQIAFGWVGEKQSRPETGTATTGIRTIPVHELYVMPKSTTKLLEDSSRDVEAWLEMKARDR